MSTRMVIDEVAPEGSEQLADDIVNVDRALRWGFNFDLGPFEAWDAIGVERSVQRMKEEGAPWWKRWFS